MTDDALLPLLAGFLVAFLAVILIRALRRRPGSRRPPPPETPLSRQHRRAMERRAQKGR